jgi:hypothetical protein
MVGNLDIPVIAQGLVLTRQHRQYTQNARQVYYFVDKNRPLVAGRAPAVP